MAVVKNVQRPSSQHCRLQDNGLLSILLLENALYSLQNICFHVIVIRSTPNYTPSNVGVHSR